MISFLVLSAVCAALAIVSITVYACKLSEFRGVKMIRGRMIDSYRITAEDYRMFRDRGVRLLSIKNGAFVMFVVFLIGAAGFAALYFYSLIP